MKKRIIGIVLIIGLMIIYGATVYASSPYTSSGSSSGGTSSGSGYGGGGNSPTGPKPGGSKPVIERPDRGVTGGSLTDPIENPGEYKPSENSSSNNTQLIERGNLVIGVIQLLGSAISVITLMTLGIRYMLAGIQEKALYKETMGPYLIGAVMVFAIPNIIAIVYDFITGNIKDN